MDWFRHYHGCAFDPKWRTVARRARASIERVNFVWDSLMEHASSNDDRGSVAGWSAELVADHLMCEADEIAAIRREFDEIGVIADGRLAAWGKRQPSDSTAAERMRRLRERQKAVAPAADAIANGVTPRAERNGAPQKRNALHQNRTEQSRADSETEQSRKDSPAASRSTPAASSTPAAGADPPGFVEFYQAYPRHKARSAAVKAYASARRSGTEPAVIMRALEGAKSEWERKGTSPEFIPHPATWLNQKRWQDEPDKSLNGHRMNGDGPIDYRDQFPEVPW